MKTRVAFLCALLAFYLVSLAHCAFSQDKKTETRSVSDFDGLEVGGPFDVYINPNGTEALSLTGNAEALADVITEVRAGRLVIRFDNNNRWNRPNQNPRVRVAMSVKALKSIQASASANVSTEGTLKAASLTLRASSAADLVLAIEADEVDCDLSSGADARLSGKAKSLRAEASSGADIMAEELNVESCRANASSGADIKVSVSDELEAEASSGADVRYKGEPKKVRVNSSSGGDVRRKF